MEAPQILNHPQPYKLTVENFIALAESGAFEANTRTELIDGEIYTMSALFRPHAYNHSQMIVALTTALDLIEGDLAALTAPSVLMKPSSMPEPDIVVASGRFDIREPVTIDMVKLAVEIADSTVAFDLVRKGRLYAQHSVPEYWVLDLGGRVIHKLWEPDGNYFARQTLLSFGDELTSATITGLTISTSMLR